MNPGLLAYNLWMTSNMNVCKHLLSRNVDKHVLQFSILLMVISTLFLAEAAMSVNLQNFCTLKLDASEIC